MAGLIGRIDRLLAQKGGAMLSEHRRALAREIVAELRDVDAGSLGMLLAGKQALYSCSEDPELEDARGCWQAMIDAELAGES